MNAFNRHLFPDADEKYEVWAKGQIIAGIDPFVWRQDHLGNLMRFQDHGNRSSDYGWEIDHIVVSALGGSDHVSNKRPLHWRANASAGGLLGALMSLNRSGKP